MGSHGGASGTVQTENHESRSNALARQESLYSPTLGEVQNQLGDFGKPLASMNLDKLLETVLTAESSQGMGGVVYGASSHVMAGGIDGTTARDNDSRSVLGVDPLALPQQEAQWTNYQIPLVHQPLQQDTVPVFMPDHHVQPHIPIGGNPMMDVAYPERQRTMSPTILMGTSLDTQTHGRKRFAPVDVLEESDERRLKRMMKNRESAARSRARKQDYLHELENKVLRLEEENERLKRQQAMDKVLASLPTPKPRYQLRRTSSSTF